MLNLPSEMGLDVSSSGGGVYLGRTPIGYTNGRTHVSLDLFGRLLDRTDRSAINAGSVFVERGVTQFLYPTTHILVANLLLCTIPDT